MQQHILPRHSKIKQEYCQHQTYHQTHTTNYAFTYVAWTTVVLLQSSTNYQKYYIISLVVVTTLLTTKCTLLYKKKYSCSNILNYKVQTSLQKKNVQHYMQSILQQWLTLFIATVNSNYADGNIPSRVAQLYFFIDIPFVLQFH